MGPLDRFRQSEEPVVLPEIPQLATPEVEVAGAVNVLEITDVAEPTDEFPGGHIYVRFEVLGPQNEKLAELERRFEPSYPRLEIGRACAQFGKDIAERALLVKPGVVVRF